MLAPRTCITRFPGEGHEGVLAQLSRLVIFGFENRRSPHCSLGCRNNDEVLSGDAQQRLPGQASEAHTQQKR